MTIPRTSGTKVALFHKQTGQRIERWPVDARELLQRGEYSTVPPDMEPPENEEAALRVAPPTAALVRDAALITEDVSPIGAPLQVARTGTMTQATTAKGGK